MSTVVVYVIRIAVVAVGLWVAAVVVPGIELTAGSPEAQVGTLVGVALIFGLVNATIKPLIKGLGCAFYILTLGLVGLFVNALLFLLVDFLAERLGLPFSVDEFWPAFGGAIIVALVGFVLHLVIPDRIDRR